MSSSVTMASAKQAQSEADKPPFPNMVWVPGGTFLMGSDKHYPEEAPAHEVTVHGFWMDRYMVTNEEFRKFVEATKHVTSAERAPKAEDYPGAPLSTGGAYGAAHRYFDLPSGLSLYRSGEQVAVSVLEYLARENGEEFASRKDAKDAKFGKIKVWAAKKKTFGLAGPLRA